MQRDVAQLLQEAQPVLAATPGVTFAYVFGSLAKGTAHADSDFDVAVHFGDLPPGDEGSLDAADRQFDLARRLRRALQCDVDVIVLNTARVALRQTILNTGRVLMVADPLAHRDFREHQLHAYVEYRDLEQVFARYRLRRIKEGAFGGGEGHGPQAHRRD